MSTIIKKQFIILSLLLLGLSCAKDEGNYSYTEINQIKVTGIEDSYTVYSGENLYVAPSLNPTIDDGSNQERYTYEWVAIDDVQAVTLRKKIVISKTKDFNEKVKLPPSRYKVYYIVKDTSTGIVWQQEPFELNVVNSIYEGWLVIGDDANGKARLDMVSILPNVDVPLIIPDVLDTSRSDLKLTGRALDVSFFQNPFLTPLIDGIYVTASESGTARIDPNTFGWTQTQNIVYEMLGSFPSNFAVNFMKSPGSGENFIYSEGNIYYRHRAQQKPYSYPQNILAGETKEFVASPFIAENGGSIGAPVFYNQDSRSFVRFNYTADSCSPITPAGTLFGWSNTNCDLVYMTTSINGPDTKNLAVLKDITTNKYYILVFAKTLVQDKYEEIVNAPDFDQATKFAVSPDKAYLFYAVGGKLYEYNYGDGTTKKMLDKGSEEITFIAFNRLAKTSATRLVVGSYNGTEGKLELFNVPILSGDLDLFGTYEGLCKIVDVEYRPR